MAWKEDVGLRKSDAAGLVEKMILQCCLVVMVALGCGGDENALRWRGNW